VLCERTWTTQRAVYAFQPKTCTANFALGHQKIISVKCPHEFAKSLTTHNNATIKRLRRLSVMACAARWLVVRSYSVVNWMAGRRGGWEAWL